MPCTEMQLWPANEKACAASLDAASSTSVSAWTITGVAFPSSRSTFFRLARSAAPSDLGGGPAHHRRGLPGLQEPLFPRRPLPQPPAALGGARERDRLDPL